MTQHIITVTMTVHDNGFVDVGVQAAMPPHVVRMALAEALSAVQEQLLSTRLGATPRQVVLARPNGMPGGAL